MPTSTLTSKGQITLPRAVRERLRLETGDLVDFVIDDDGEIRVRAGRYDARDLRGLLRKQGRKPVSLAEMDQTIARRGGRTT
jgi:AbrB family looped-hinge helix DNA binding protein